MYKKCTHCKKSYIEQDEEICINCWFLFAEKNECDHESERIIEEWGDNEFLNDKGASFISK